ncbi:MAG: hypothetical protein ACHQUC_00100 [Chlamydiales bacterium]
MVAEQFKGEHSSKMGGGGHSLIGEPSFETSEWVFQFHTGLDQLEIEVKDKHQDSADFSFLFDKIRKKLKAKRVKGIDEDLETLEELLEVNKA